MTEEKYWFWLCNLENIWNGKIKILLDEFGNPQNVFNANKKELISLTRLSNNKISEKDVTIINNSRNVEKIENNYSILKTKKVHFIYKGGENYPIKLKEIYDAPYGLYIMGKKVEDNLPYVAVIGARNASSYGINIAKQIGFDLAVNGINVISGMARGIDSSAQIGALTACGMTTSVLGCGVDICYPRENIDLYEQIKKENTIISEYPLGSQPVGWKFPQRNRIISGLSDIVIVVEAKEKSGSLITVEYALSQGKDIYALPGRINDELSKGCNRLIREGAGIFTCSKDIITEINNKYNINVKNSKKILKNKITLANDLESLYSNVDLSPKSIQRLAKESGASVENTIKNLVKLQLMELIEEPTKNYYSKKL